MEDGYLLKKFEVQGEKVDEESHFNIHQRSNKKKIRLIKEEIH